MFRARARRRWAALLLLLLPTPALACDICAVYTGFDMQATETGLRLGLGEQYTRFGTLQNNSVEVPNPNHEYLDSSITQLLFGYQFLPRAGVQVVVPIISRSYRRGTRSGIENGNVSGFGDISVVANFLAFNYVSMETVALLSLLGGFQLPSGNSSLLGEEVPCTPPHSRECMAQTGGFYGQSSGFEGKHIGNNGGVQSGVHGHDLALGSGAVDVVAGARTFASWNRIYGDMSLQYSLRSAGSFDYQYADELTATGGPGVFLLTDDDYTLGFQAVLTANTKGNDTVNGQRLDDTAFTGLYVGPGLHFTWSTRLSAELAADLPVIENNSGLQIVPDYRLRFGAVWRW